MVFNIYFYLVSNMLCGRLWCSVVIDPSLIYRSVLGEAGLSVGFC
jgi:hypothetical protein